MRKSQRPARLLTSITAAVTAVALTASLSIPTAAADEVEVDPGAGTSQLPEQTETTDGPDVAVEEGSQSPLVSGDETPTDDAAADGEAADDASDDDASEALEESEGSGQDESESPDGIDDEPAEGGEDRSADSPEAASGDEDASGENLGGASPTAEAEANSTVSPSSTVITPEIETISPASGALTGGDIITITGTNLNRVVGSAGSTSAVFFGGSQGTGGTAGRLMTKSSTSLTVIVPRGAAAGAVDVTLVTSDVRVTREGGYRYLQPEITSVTPSSGSTTGGQSITIHGVGFGFTTGTLGNSTVSSVTVGGVAATSVTRVNSTTITARTPARSAGAADVVVTVGPSAGAPIDIIAADAFNFVAAPAAPTVNQVTPANGPTAGGNEVIVRGTNLRGSNTNLATVNFGSTPATVTGINPDNTQLTVTVPAGAVGKVNITVETNDGRATMLNGYEYGSPPTITSVTPASGPIPGGTRITINGTNFGSAGTPTVTVGEAPARCVERISATEISAVVPAGASGAADVVVTSTSGGGSATRAGGFSYVASTTSPTISGISPSTGPITGRTPITISGTNLGGSGTPTVLINGTCATDVTSVSATSITATTPPGPAGLATVQVTTATGSTTSTLFSYVAISSVVPGTGPTTGGTNITISGSGFGSDPTVTVGGVEATVVSSSPTRIVATTPPGATGAQDVVVTPDGSAPISRSRGFRYVAPTVTSVSPNAGLLAGGNTVTVTGTGFGSSGTPSVTFAGVAATAVNRISTTSLTATVPAGAELGAVDVVVTPTAGTGSGTLEAGYTYVPPVRTPLITSVTPNRGSSDGGTAMTVLGANFRGSNDVAGTVTLGGQAVVGLSVAPSGDSITFTTPAMTPGTKTLRITTNEGTANYLLAFSSIGPPVVGGGCAAVSPRGAVNYTGSNQVTVSGSGFRASGDPEPTVTVNGVAATVISATNTQVRFTIPEVPLGTLNIIITPTDGAPLTLSGCISLQRILTVTAIATPSAIGFGDPTAAFSFSTAGLQSGDAVSSVSLTFTGTGATSYGPSFDPPTGGGTYAVTPSNASFSSGSAGNYSIVYVPASYTINGIAATVTADDKTITYGDAAPTFTSTAVGLAGSDALGDVTYTFSGSGYGPSTTPPTNVGTYSIEPMVKSLSPGDLANYSFTATAGTYTINKRPVTVTPDSGQSKVYDGLALDPSTVTFTVTTGSLVGSDSLSDVLTVSGTAVGNYEITKSGLADASNPNYDITVTPGVNFEITRLPVTVTPTGDTKVYGNTDPIFGYTTSPEVFLSGDLGRATGENVGPYAINLGTISNDNNPNYDVSLGGSAEFEITKRPVTITAEDQEITFGEALPDNAVTVSDGSLASGDALTGADYAYTPDEPADAGDYDITPSNAVITPGGASNYDITYVDGTLTIEPVMVTVTPDADQSKVFGDDDPSLTYTTSDVPAGVSITGALGREAGGDVGTYGFELGTLSTGNDNVSLQLADPAGSFEITRKAVTVTADAATKSFGAADPEFTFTVSPDVDGGLSGSLSRDPGTDVGTYAITQGTVDDSSNPNYSITFESADLTITKAAVTVTPDADQSKVFGDDDPTLTYTADPDVTLTGSLSRAAGENVGTYAILQGTLTSTDNYDITFASGVDFEITKRPVTITAEDQEITFGEALPDNAVTVSGGSLASGDALTGADYAYTPDEPADAGDYDITPSNAVISGGASNYEITYAAGTLTIDPFMVTVTPDADQSKVFGDDDPTLTYTTSDVPAGVSITGALGRETGDDVGTYGFELGTLSTGNDNVSLQLADPAGSFEITRKAVTVTADAATKSFGASDPELTFTADPDVTLTGSLGRAAGEDVGDYAITQGTVDDSSNPNYSITFESADLTITKATVTITADADQSKVFGDDDPTLTYTADPDVTLSGSLSRDAGETVGTYDILQGTLTSTANYDITLTNGSTFEITKRPVTITAEDQEITFGEALPDNAWEITSGTLVDGDELSGVTFSYSVAEPSDAGDYDITPADGTISPSGASNYDITYSAGTLTIDTVTLTVTAGDATVPFGVEPTLSATADGLVDDDELDGVTYTFSGSGYGPSTTPPTDVGTYDISASVDSLSPGNIDNYDQDDVAGTLTIAPPAIGALLPDEGTYLGGTPFTMTGSGFGPAGSAPTVTFGGEEATGVVRVDNNTITGVTPPFDLAEEFTAELVDVGVSFAGGPADLLPDAYTYLPPRPTPIMVTLFPDSGPTAGGTELTITGTNLGGSDDVAPTVFVNETAAPEVTVADAGSLVAAKTPPGPSGEARDVELFTNEGAVAFPAAFTYISPAITAVSPNRGYVIGGSTVEVTGSGFGTAVPAVTIGGVAAEVTSNSATSITIISPPGALGSADVVVQPAGDPETATLEDGFSYVAVPTGDVRGLKWLDLNKNGVYNPPEEPFYPNLPVQITLIEYVLPPLEDDPVDRASMGRAELVSEVEIPAGSIIVPGNLPPQQTLTNDVGRYRFNDLPYGRYRITLNIPSDLVTTYAPPGSRDGQLEFVLMSPELEADTANAGQSTLVAFVANEARELFRDRSIELRWSGPDGILGTSDDLLLPTTTNADGEVEFSGGLPAGEYRAEFSDEAGERQLSSTLVLAADSTLSGEYFIFAGGVVPPDGRLPSAGAGALMVMLMLAIALISAGTALWGPFARRRVLR